MWNCRVELVFAPSAFYVRDRYFVHCRACKILPGALLCAVRAYCIINAYGSNYSLTPCSIPLDASRNFADWLSLKLVTYEWSLRHLFLRKISLFEASTFFPWNETACARGCCVVVLISWGYGESEFFQCLKYVLLLLKQLIYRVSTHMRIDRIPSVRVSNCFLSLSYFTCGKCTVWKERNNSPRKHHSRLGIFLLRHPATLHLMLELTMYVVHRWSEAWSSLMLRSQIVNREKNQSRLSHPQRA